MPPESARLYRPTLVEIVKIDLDMAGRTETDHRFVRAEIPRTGPVPVGSDRRRIPHVREANGDRPELEEFLTRFPAQYQEFWERVKLPVPRRRPVAETIHKTPARSAKTPPVTGADTGGNRQPGLAGRIQADRTGAKGTGEVWKAEGPGGVELAMKIVTQPLDQEGAQRELQSLELVKKLQRGPARGDRVLDDRQPAPDRDGLRTRRYETGSRVPATSLPGVPAEELLGYFATRRGWTGCTARACCTGTSNPKTFFSKGYAKVADFGLAKRHLERCDRASPAPPAFMAPEIWGQGQQGQRPVQQPSPTRRAAAGSAALKGEGLPR